MDWMHIKINRKKHLYGALLSTMVFVSDANGNPVCRKRIRNGKTLLDDIAPVIAIGRPPKKYLPMGAWRIPTDTQKWQEKVVEMAEAAQLVALRLGDTEGIWWEVEYCIKNMDLRKLLLILPNLKDQSVVGRVRELMEARGIDVTDFPLKLKRKRKGSIWGFLYFDDSERLVCRQLRDFAVISLFISHEDSIREAVGDVSLRFEVKTRKRKNRIWAMGFLCTNTILCLFVALSMYVNFQSLKHDRYPKDLITAGESLGAVNRKIEGWSHRSKTDYLFSCI